MFLNDFRRRITRKNLLCILVLIPKLGIAQSKNPPIDCSNNAESSTAAPAPIHIATKSITSSVPCKPFPTGLVNLFLFQSFLRVN